MTPANLHRAFQERQAHWPQAFSATSTHDTKRSEDIRARLNVLSELPEEWQACLSRWSRLNQAHRVAIEDVAAPDANEEYLLYQTLLGAWPLGVPHAQEYAAFVERIQAYMRKALQEAKVHTSWINPNSAYDEAVQQFIAGIRDRELSKAFLQDLQAFQQRVSHYGMFNSLGQVLLKITAPGVADIYQGMDLWDFSLVDPDNRRPVDYAQRRQMLSELQSQLGMAGSNFSDLARELTANKADGRIKLFTTRQGLHCRREHPGLFTSGT